MPKSTILTFVKYYLPGYKAGGPIRTISNMAEALGDEFEFRIVCSDRDFQDGRPYPGIPVNTWCRMGKAWVYYASPRSRSLGGWMHLMRQTPHDLVYLNSFFDPMYALRPLLASRLRGWTAKPVMIAPRGEFSPGAVRLKAWKKKPFLILAKLLGFYRHVLWHASTDNEAQFIRQQMGIASKIAVALNLPSKSPNVSMPNSDGEPTPDLLRIVYLSRITRKKNLDFTLRVFAKTRIKIQFDIWGVLEDEIFWKECQDLIRTMPKNVEVSYRGTVNHTEVHRILSGYDLLFLPTSGENFGHVIAEAISVGTPLLLSDQTPWRNLYNKGIGWDLPLEHGEEDFRKALEEASHKVGTKRVTWRQQVLAFAADRLNDPSILEANRTLFVQAVTAKTKYASGDV